MADLMVRVCFVSLIVAAMAFLVTAPHASSLSQYQVRITVEDSQ